MWFEPISTWFVALVSAGIPFLNEKTSKSIPIENWANKELIHKDRMSGISEKEIIKRAESGRYYIPNEVFQAYPIPHRDPKDNKIIIENDTLYNEDLINYGAFKTYKWVDQGKYNLTKEEMEIENLRLKRKYALLYNKKDELDKIDKILSVKKIDWHNTEAAQQWKKACVEENKYH
ncbi:MAG: hypothetical protein IJA17_02665 [Oscillospiraceae bacterium]|nr:hypothetical protein [Oscillospiraceae bacterium]